MRIGSFWKSAVPIFLGMVCLQVGLAQSAGQQQPAYTAEEYDAFTRAINEADLAKREAAIINFMKARPNSALNQYAIGTYLQLMQQYQTEGKVPNVISAGEKYLAVQPNDLNALYMTAAAHYQAQQFDKAAKHGDKLFSLKAEAPSTAEWMWPRMAFILADAYVMLNNDAKIAEYGEKACETFEPKDCYRVLAELTRVFAAQEQWTKAADYARKTIQGFEAAEKAMPNPDARWKEYVSTKKALAYAVLGRQAAERQNWSGAVQNYQTALRTNSSIPALNAEAYYYIGLGHWKQNRIDPAMEAFARGCMQRGAPHAKHCRQHLETLYKSSHNDSLAGLDEFIQRVTGKSQ